MLFKKTYSAGEVTRACLLTDYVGVPLNKQILSPLRQESNPSFHIFNHKSKGVQYFADNGSGQYGDIIQFHILYTGQTNFNDACAELMQRNRLSVGVAADQSDDPLPEPPKAEKKHIDYGIRSNTPIERSRYIRYTRLSIPKWVSATFKMFVDTKANICIPNVAGGLHLKGGFMPKKGKTFATNVGPAGISIGGNMTATQWFIVEGIGDLLALVDGIVGEEHHANQHGYVLLNSTGNTANGIDIMKASIPSGAAISLYLDKFDDVADKATTLIQQHFPQAIDHRAEITHGKDLRDMWDARRAV